MVKRGGSVVFVDFSRARLARAATCARYSIAAGTPSPAHMNGIADAAARGKLAAKIGRTVPLADAVEAITELETKGTPKGKLVIMPGS
jgi:NADPH:quinone reductase-like Zn-dependent oxidoreductase